MLKKFVYILCIYMKSNFAFLGRFFLFVYSKKHLICLEIDEKRSVNSLKNLNYLLALGEHKILVLKLVFFGLPWLHISLYFKSNESRSRYLIYSKETLSLCSLKGKKIMISGCEKPRFIAASFKIL